MHYSISGAELLAVLLVFCRIGTISMFLPAIGENTVPVKLRLAFALLLSLIISAITPPPITSNPQALQLMLYIFEEFIIGLAIGIAIKTIQTALHIMGSIFAYQAGLSSGSIFDPTFGSQGTAYGTFFSLCFVVLLLAYDLHLEIIRALSLSYTLFPFSSLATHYSSFTDLIIRTSSDAFNIGTRLAAPFLVVGILLNIGTGILSRLMPQMQVFFIIMPAQILIHTLILFTTTGGLLLWFVDYYQQYLHDILR